MCKAEGMGLAPWGALGGGAFKSEEQLKSQGAAGRRELQSEKQRAVSKVLESIAKRKNTAITSVALAYVMHKTPHVFPIIGGRKVEHLKGNIEALTLRLSNEDIKDIESAYPFDLGFPHNFVWANSGVSNPQEVFFVQMCGTMDLVPEPQVSVGYYKESLRNAVADFTSNSPSSLRMEENSVLEIGRLCGGGFHPGILTLRGWATPLVSGNDDSVARDRNPRAISRSNPSTIYVACL